MNKPFLVYRYRGLVWEFCQDHIEIKDPVFGRIYKIEMVGTEYMPFVITLLQQGVFMEGER